MKSLVSSVALTALIFTASALGAGSALGAASPRQDALTTRVPLHSVMQAQIARQVVGGYYLHLDPDSGEVQLLQPGPAHELVLRMGDYFVLCAEFFDPKGNEVSIDFYLAKRNQDYVVFATQVGNRSLLDRLKKGRKLVAFD